MESGQRVIAALRRHRLAREAKILAALEALGAATLERLTPAVYDDVAVERHPWAQLTLEAHLVKLARDGRVIEKNGCWSPTRA